MWKAYYFPGNMRLVMHNERAQIIIIYVQRVNNINHYLTK